MARTSIAALALALALAPACVIDDAEADLRLFWDFSGVDGCPADVEVVRISVFGPDGFDELADVPCDRGPLFIGDLEPGTYQLELLGFPPGGGGPTWIASDLFVDLFGGLNEYTVTLVPLS